MSGWLVALLCVLAAIIGGIVVFVWFIIAFMKGFR